MSEYRHTNGGGRVVGREAYVSPDSFFDRESSAEGDARVFSSVVTNSALRGAQVSGCSLNATLLADCIVAGAPCLGPVLDGVSLVGVRVEGLVSLAGPWSMKCPGAWIHSGEWHRAPRALRITGEGGMTVALVECVEGRAHVGCKCRPTSHWLDRGPAIGRRLGWTEEHIEAARLFFEGLK